MGLFVVNSEGTKVSQLQYADDTILFYDCDKEQILLLKDLLTVFSACSGMKINNEKSAIFEVIGNDEIQWAAELFGCQVGTFPITYLDLPLGGRSMKALMWESIFQNNPNQIK